MKKQFSRIYRGWSGIGEDRLVIGLPTKGCLWVRKGKPCIHCSAVNVTRKFHPIEDPELFIINEIENHKHRSIGCICFYTAGSSLDITEIDDRNLEAILIRMKNCLNPSKIVLESHPAFIDGKRLARYIYLLENTNLEIVMPLETTVKNTREHIGKKFSNRYYEAKMKEVKDSGSKCAVSLLLKPPGLTEAESIREIDLSIRWVSKLGADRIIIEPMVVYPKTRLAQLFYEGKYRTAWLWTILHLCEKYLHEEKVELGGEFEYPIPISRPYNCMLCSNRVNIVLKRYQKRRSLEGSREIGCPCKKEWQNEINNN